MNPVSLGSPGVATAVAERIKKEIDAYCVRAYDDGWRSHLGASVIGRECPRELWYAFRWAGAKPLDGRLYRLFNRGHREEERFVEWLRGIGFTIETHDVNGQQIRVMGVGGHFGGSRDGAGLFPPEWNILEKRVLLEFKTSGTGSKFANLEKNGVIVEKQDHFGQMSVYGFKAEPEPIEYALYLCINKNDDSLHVEIVKLDFKLAAQLESRAQQIITDLVPPPRMSESRAFWKCKFCDFLAQCHDKAPMAKSCRSCTYSRPAEGKAWVCIGPGNGQVIPDDFVKLGCQHWDAIAK